MRFIFYLLILGFTSSALADEGFRFGGQVSANRYNFAEPSGKAAVGSGLSFSGIALYELDRSGRLMLNVNRDSYVLAASTSEVGQDVTSIGGGLSYQYMWRMTRDIKPWFGVGLGYSSAAYRKRFTLTPGGFSARLPDRDSTELSMLLNSNIEWALSYDWDMGLQAQYSSAFDGKANSLRLGLYFVY